VLQTYVDCHLLHRNNGSLCFTDPH